MLIRLPLLSCVMLVAAKRKAAAPDPEPATVLDALSAATGVDAATLAKVLPGAILGALLAALCYWGIGRRRRALPADFMQPVDPSPGPVCGSTASGSYHAPGSDSDDSDDSDGIVADPAPRRRPK